MERIDRYSCEEVFRRLDDYLDGRLTAEEVALIDEHLDVCEQCASEYRFEGSVLDELKKKLRAVELPAGLKGRIAAILKQAREELSDGGGPEP